VKIIFNFDEELQKYGLTRETFEQCLDDSSKKVQHITDDVEWQDIVEKYNLGIHYDTLRKSQQPTPFGGAFIKEYFTDKYASSESEHDDSDGYFNQLRLERQEIRKEKQRLFDERAELNKRLRDEARLEDRLDKIEESLNCKGREEFPIHDSVDINSDNDLIVVLSDLHIGATHYSFTGCYDSDIAKERLSKYLEEIIKIQKRHKSQNVYVSLLGDQISGSIHQSIAVSNRENVIEQVTTASALVSDFIYELSKIFRYVYVNSVNGNHSRLTKKDDAVKDERLDFLIMWYAKAKLSHISNIEFSEDELDSTIATMIIRGKTYVSVHGDCDGYNDSSVAKLALWLGYTPYCVLYGHMHHPAMSQVAGVIMVQSGSLAGSGDEYTIQKRLRGNASQSVLVCTDNGIECCYPINLS